MRSCSGEGTSLLVADEIVVTGCYRFQSIPIGSRRFLGYVYGGGVFARTPFSRIRRHRRRSPIRPVRTCQTARQVLLDASSFVLVNTANYNHDTPLHTVAAATNSVPLERLREVCWLLVHAGGQTNLLNRQGKTPLALVSSERRDVVRKIFYRRSR